MASNIKNPGVDRLVEAVVERTHVSKTDAVRQALEAALDRAPYARVAAPTLAAAMIVLASRDVPPTVLPALPAAEDIDVVAFGSDHAYEAASADRRFGRGRHPAARNVGDRLAYAEARVADARLLFVGEDIARTVRVAPSPEESERRRRPDVTRGPAPAPTFPRP